MAVFIDEQVNKHWSVRITELQAQLAERDREIERAYSMLAVNGVSKERAKYLSTGIDVLVTRMRKEITAQSQTILEQQAMLKATLHYISKDIQPDEHLPEIIDRAIQLGFDLSALESALKAERIKTLEDYAIKVLKDFSKFDDGGIWVKNWLNNMANELKEKQA